MLYVKYISIFKKEALNVTLSHFPKEAKTSLTAVFKLLYWLCFLPQNPIHRAKLFEASVLLQMASSAFLASCCPTLECLLTNSLNFMQIGESAHIQIGELVGDECIAIWVEWILLSHTERKWRCSFSLPSTSSPR